MGIIASKSKRSAVGTMKRKNRNKSRNALRHSSARHRRSGLIQHVPQLLLVEFLDHRWVLHLDLRRESPDGPGLVDARCSQLRHSRCWLRFFFRAIAARLYACRPDTVARLGNSRHRCGSPATKDPAAGLPGNSLFRSRRKALVSCNPS